MTAAEDRSKAKNYTDVGFLALNDVSTSCCENIMPYIKGNMSLFFFSYMPPVDVQNVLQHHFSFRVWVDLHSWIWQLWFLYSNTERKGV